MLRALKIVNLILSDVLATYMFFGVQNQCAIKQRNKLLKKEEF